MQIEDPKKTLEKAMKKVAGIITPPPPDRKPKKIIVEREPEKQEIQIRTVESIPAGSRVCLAVPAKTSLSLLKRLYKIQRVRPNGTVVLKPVKSPTATV